jgi:hypothetical protein
MLSPARFLQALGNVRRAAQQTRHVSGSQFAIAAYWLAVRTPPLFQQQFRFHWRHHPFWARSADGVGGVRGVLHSRAIVFHRTAASGNEQL